MNLFLNIPSLYSNNYLIVGRRFVLPNFYSLKNRIRTFSAYICGSFKSAKIATNRKSANRKQILGTQIANPQIATLAEGPQIITNFESPQIGGFAICGTYLRTGHLCKMDKEIH
jgi:hypothetical protein